MQYHLNGNIKKAIMKIPLVDKEDEKKYQKAKTKANCLKNLKASIDETYEYKLKAKTDTEFKAYWDDEEFKAIIQLYTVK